MVGAGAITFQKQLHKQALDNSTAFCVLNRLQNLTFVLFFSSLTPERDRETIEELSAALRDEKARAEQMQLALTKERRQTEALKHAKERVDQLRNVNKGRTIREMVAGRMSFSSSIQSRNSPLLLRHLFLLCWF